METVLVSARNGPKEVCTLFATVDHPTLPEQMVKPLRFLGPNWNPYWFTTDHFPKAQIDFPPQPYTWVTTVMPDSVEALLRPEDIEIAAVEPEITLAHDRYTVAEVRLTNRSQHTLGAILQNGTPMRLSYHLLAEDGTMFMSEGRRTELEIDIPAGTSHVHALVIERPVPNGTYHVQVDLVTEGRRWWGINTPLIVHAGW
jgi:hypothetical protein